jgi:hypothetical protein
LGIQGAADEILRRQAAAAGPKTGASYGRLYAPPAQNMDELRRQQAQFARTREDLDRRNSWMAIPALAPAAAVLGIEAGAALAARLAPAAVARGPAVLTERMPYLRVGDNWATRGGRRADKFYKDMGRAKQGWKPEPRIDGPEGLLKPDLRAPHPSRCEGKIYRSQAQHAVGSSRGC